MLNLYQQLDPSSHPTVFYTRLGLTVIDATGGTEHPAVRAVAAALIHRTTMSRDGYAARDLLTHDHCAEILSDDQQHALTRLLQASALERKEIPPELRAILLAALATSDAVLRRALSVRPGADTSYLTTVDAK